jgi:hypothetical protein
MTIDEARAALAEREGGGFSSAAFEVWISGFTLELLRTGRCGAEQLEKLARVPVAQDGEVNCNPLARGKGK